MPLSSRNNFNFNCVFSSCRYDSSTIRSTIVIHLWMLHSWRSYIDHGDCADCVYFNFSKVPDRVLTSKLRFHTKIQRYQVISTKLPFRFRFRPSSVGKRWSLSARFSVGQRLCCPIIYLRCSSLTHL